MAEHGTASDALNALPDIARSYGEKDYRPCSHDQACAELAAGRKIGASLLFYGEPNYPTYLTRLDDAPPFLWALGRIELINHPTIAIVGARNASSLGLRMARHLSGALAEKGYAIVSGLARGIDTAAHEAALSHATIAVLANGLDETYPKENAKLSLQIAQHGLLVSEHPPGTKPQARHFPMRNRIVSGLCEAVIVVEAAAKSGSLLTARAALDQGREVLVVPGHPFDARAAGCNMLIRDGARLIRSPDDVVEALTPLATPADTPANTAPHSAAPAATLDTTPQPTTKAPTPEAILARLSPTPISEDALIRDFNCGANLLIPVLVQLEIMGKIERHSGGLVSLAPTQTPQNSPLTNEVS